jgi:cytoskeletal protein RodZ
MNKKPDETIDPEKRLGEILKTERLKRGLSYEQIFELTKLRPSIIDALENEEWDKLPPSVFVKGFIKSYAQTLNLDPNSIL